MSQSSLKNIIKIVKVYTSITHASISSMEMAKMACSDYLCSQFSTLWSLYQLIIFKSDEKSVINDDYNQYHLIFTWLFMLLLFWVVNIFAQKVYHP